MHEGAPIGQSLSEDIAFPPMVGHIVKIGEKTGELGKIADFYEGEVDTRRPSRSPRSSSRS